MVGLKRDDVQSLIDIALREDIGEGDVTTDWTVPDDAPGEADIVAKAKGVVAGLDVAAWVFDSVNPAIRFDPKVSEGQEVGPGDLVASVTGPARGLLTGERTALNFLQRLSGVATMTARYVEAVAGTQARILDTRKTIPGWRLLDKYAVSVGGGTNHRIGLFDMVLLKENHIEAAGGIGPAVAAVRRGREKWDAAIPIEVEVARLNQIEEALMASVDQIMLDNMNVDEMWTAVQMVSEYGDERPKLEASGNVSLRTVREIAETGVDYISVGSLTHSAVALDLSMLFK